MKKLKTKTLIEVRLESLEWDIDQETGIFRKIDDYSVKNAPRPGIEPGPPGWKPGILTPRPSGTDDIRSRNCIIQN